MSKSLKIVLGIAFLLVLCVGVVIAIFLIQIGQEEAKFGALADGCRGNPVNGTAAYSEQSGIHQAMGMFMYESGTISPYAYVIPTEAVATKLADVELILCLGEQKEVVIERCPYGDENDDTVTNVVERVVYEQELVLVEAQTGTTLARETLQGSAPRECLDTEAFTAGQTTLVVKGEKVADVVIEDWVRAYAIIP